MRCSVQNPRLEAFGDTSNCPRGAEWVLQPLALTYPGNELQGGRAVYLCPGHFVEHVTRMAMEFGSTVAGVRAVRIEHASAMAEVAQLRSGR